MIIKLDDHSPEVLRKLSGATHKAATIISLKAEGHAKRLCPVGTPESTHKKDYKGGTLRNSITGMVEEFTIILGSNVDYAPFVELGTGPHFEMPPSWVKFTSKKGNGLGKGFVHARPFIRPAIEEHKSEYKRIWENELKNS